MLKKHINKHVKGENSQKAKKGQKRAITQLRKKTTANLPTIESNKRKKNKLTLPIPSKPSMKRNQQHMIKLIKHQYPMLAHTPHTLTQKQDKTKTKHQNKPSSKNKKSVTYLHYWKENMLSFSCFLNVLTLRDNLISLGKEFQKLGPDVFTPLDANFFR